MDPVLWHAVPRQIHEYSGADLLTGQAQWLRYHVEVHMVKVLGLGELSHVLFLATEDFSEHAARAGEKRTELRELLLC